MGDQLADLVFADAVAERSLEITTQLILAANRDEGCCSDQTAIALREAGAFPHLPINYLLGKLERALAEPSNTVEKLLRRPGSGLVLSLDKFFQALSHSEDGRVS
jgi:hypothetical protein